MRLEECDGLRRCPHKEFEGCGIVRIMYKCDGLRHHPHKVRALAARDTSVMGYGIVRTMFGDSSGTLLENTTS